MTDAYFPLSNILVDGPDAYEFLQGQLSNDMRRLDTEPSLLSAWCNPKGRVIWFGSIEKTASGFALSCPTEIAADIVERLGIFRFRAKVTFSIQDSDLRLERGQLVREGEPLIGDAQSESFTPHMLNLDRLDAISLDKGCYTGQEIVARTHYKGATKRRTLRFGVSDTVQVGDKVLSDGKPIGEVLNVSADECLAVVAVAKADAPITIGPATAKKLPLPYSV